MNPAKYSRYYTYIKPVIENKYVRSFSTYVFSLVAMTIFIVFAIRPTFSTILNLQKEIEEARQTLTALQTKSNNLSTGRTNLQALGQDTRTKINEAVPETAAVTSLISNLRNSSGSQASTSALQLQPVTLYNGTAAPREARTTLDEVSFSYNVQGTFQNLLSTLSNLQKAPRLISIGNAVISKQPEGTPVLSVSGKAYFLK